MPGEQSVVRFEADEANLQPKLRLLRSLAVLGLLGGAVFTIALPFGLERLHSGSISGDLRAHLRSDPVTSPSVDVIWLYTSSAIGAGLAAMLMVGSIGAIALRRWARPVLLMWAIPTLLLGLVELWFAGRWLLPPWRDDMAQVRGVVDTLSNLGGIGVMAALAAPVLWLLLTPEVKEQLR